MLGSDLSPNGSGPKCRKRLKEDLRQAALWECGAAWRRVGSLLSKCPLTWRQP